MPVLTSRLSRLALVVAFGAAVAGCGSFNSASQRFASSLAPYKVQVVQGNFVSREQVEALKPGMSREQVQAVLGTPLVASVFHADRWDYVFTLKRAGVQSQARRLTVFFKDDRMERTEGDTMPSEAEFVATIDDKKRQGRAVPVLEATEAQLERFGAGSKPQGAAPGTDAAPPPATSYPPLEAPAR